MKKTRLRLLLCSGLVAAWLCVIWGNSLLSGEESSQVSGWAGQILEKLLPFINMDADGAMLILRKLGHLSEFAILGGLLMWLFGMLGRKPWLPFVCGVAAACVDETIQLSSPGRCGCVTDVLIDAAGVAVGVGVLLLCGRIKRKRKK